MSIEHCPHGGQTLAYCDEHGEWYCLACGDSACPTCQAYDDADAPPFDDRGRAQ